MKIGLAPAMLGVCLSAVQAVMKITNIIIFAIASLIPQIVPAHGTVYLSNLGQTSAGSHAVASDTWYATLFATGTNSSGYDLNSVQLAMSDASGTPGNFMVMIYSN